MTTLKLAIAYTSRNFEATPKFSNPATEKLYKLSKLAKLSIANSNKRIILEDIQKRCDACQRFTVLISDSKYHFQDRAS